jgi:DNA replication protein DnaC
MENQIDHLIAFVEKKLTSEPPKPNHDSQKIAALMQKFAKHRKIDWVFSEPELKIINHIWNGDNGIILNGQIGNGKTTIFRLANDALNLMGMKCEFINVAKLCHLVAQNGEIEIIKRETGMLIIDDLGAEMESVSNYGNKMNPVKDLLFLRYENRARTFVTTNFNAEMLKTKYGERLSDRFKEMFKIYTFFGSSKR